ncbi:MAG: hypothetical protein SPL52_11885, partial [Fibrobacter sp.]|nr:hypothetical protein [Fibrobacter sp.]
PDCGGEQVASAAIRSPYKKRGLCTKFLYKSLLTINTVCHVRLQAVARDSRFARYCEDNTLADALFSRRLTIISYTVIFSRIY